MSLPILIPTWNRKRYSELCIERLMRVPEPIHLVIADNGSTDGTQDWLATLSGNDRVTIERWYFKKNFGLYRVSNLFFHEMLKRNMHPYCGWTYADMCPPENWVGVLSGILNSIPTAGMAFPCFSPYRNHNPSVNMSGYEVFVNNTAYFSNGFGLIRLDVFRKFIEKGEYPYISSNHPGLSLGNFFAHVQQDWLLLSSSQVDQTPACAVESHNKEEAYRRQDVLAKRKYALDSRAYYDATSGLLTWTVDGVEHTWDDEPAESIGIPLTENLTLRAALDAGVEESDISLLS